MKNTVLLMAHGSPESVDQMEAFLGRIRKPTPEMVAKMQERYHRIGGRSPLLEITRRQAAALQKALDLPVRVGMLNWDPSIRDALEEIDADRIVGLPATPFGGPFGSEKYFEAAGDVVRVPSWATEPRLVRAWVGRITDTLDDHTILFTAHSVPVDCGAYADEVRALTSAIVELIGDVPWELAWQSRSPVPGDWLEPDVDTKLKELAGRRVLVVPIGFLCDHVEILYDLDIMHRETAGRLGVPYERVPMLNDAPMLIDAMAAVVRSVL